MRYMRILIPTVLLIAPAAAPAQEPPPPQPAVESEAAALPEEDGGPVLSEEISDEAIWGKASPLNKPDASFIPSEAISADAAIAFPVDI